VNDVEQHPKSGHGVLLVHRAKPGRRDDVRDVWMAHMAPAVAGNDEHLAYYYCFDLADADVICAFQLYVSAEAAAAFLTRDSYRRYLDAVEPLLAGPPEIHPLAPMWTKGAPPDA
jgi:quinol monooxygenase YgiN